MKEKPEFLSGISVLDTKRIKPLYVYFGYWCFNVGFDWYIFLRMFEYSSPTFLWNLQININFICSQKTSFFSGVDGLTGFSMSCSTCNSACWNCVALGNLCNLFCFWHWHMQSFGAKSLLNLNALNGHLQYKLEELHLQFASHKMQIRKVK